MALNKANTNATAATFESEEKDETMTQNTAPAAEQVAPATTALAAIGSPLKEYGQVGPPEKSG